MTVYGVDIPKEIERRQMLISRFKSEFIRHMFYGMGEDEPNIYRIMGETHDQKIVLQNIRNSKYLVWDEDKVKACEFVILAFVDEPTFIPAKDKVTAWRWKSEGKSSPIYKTDPRMEYGMNINLRVDRWIEVK